MLSLFNYSKLPEINLEKKPLPKIIDFNTIDKGTNEVIIKDVTKVGINLLWPFGSKNSKKKEPADDEKATTLLLDSNDRVIAMKKIDLSNLKDDNDDSNYVLNNSKLTIDTDNDNEEFIDIQVRQLSYAEVAALNNGHKETKHNTNIVVIDQDTELEKSITDLEMMDKFKTCEKEFSKNNDIVFDSLNFDDEWDTYVKNKTSKKLSRKKKHSKQRK